MAQDRTISLQERVDAEIGKLQKNLHTYNSRLAALNEAFVRGEAGPITIEQSIDLILDAIPQTEEALWHLTRVADRLRAGQSPVDPTAAVTCESRAGKAAA